MALFLAAIFAFVSLSAVSPASILKESVASELAKPLRESIIINLSDEQQTDVSNVNENKRKSVTTRNPYEELKPNDFNKLGSTVKESSRETTPQNTVLTSSDKIQAQIPNLGEKDRKVVTTKPSAKYCIRHAIYGSLICEPKPRESWICASDGICRVDGKKLKFKYLKTAVGSAAKVPSRESIQQNIDAMKKRQQEKVGSIVVEPSRETTPQNIDAMKIKQHEKEGSMVVEPSRETTPQNIDAMKIKKHEKEGSMVVEPSRETTPQNIDAMKIKQHEKEGSMVVEPSRETTPRNTVLTRSDKQQAQIPNLGEKDRKVVTTKPPAKYCIRHPIYGYLICEPKPRESWICASDGICRIDGKKLKFKNLKRVHSTVNCKSAMKGKHSTEH